jgi:hypothetical protein
MKKSTKIALSLVASTMLFTGCGGGGAADPSSGGSAGGGDNKTPITVEKNAKAQLGVLSKAMIKVYELGTSPHKLLFTEITTDGNTVEAIGNFNAHEKELNADKFYLYEVHGGNDMDVDDDGMIDSSPTINEGIFRAVVKGSDVKSLGGKFKVTAISEIQYKKVEKHIDNIAVLEEKLKEAPELIIKDDLNNDGKIDAKDILLYNPVKHEHKLEKVYKDKLEKIVDDIHKKDTEIDVSIVPKIEGNTFIIAENATSGNKVGQVEILDDGQAPIIDFTLKGEGNSKFTIDEKGVIRVNALSVLSLKTLKVYNLKAVAKNRIGESNEADIRINVMEIDKTAPVFTSADTISVAENSSLSHTVEVTDDSSVTFELEGDDSEFFNFNSASKKLTFNQALDFETPKDENGDNVYEVTIKATDSAGNSSSQSISVTLTDVSDVVPVLVDGSFEITDTSVGSVVGTVTPSSIGDSEITAFTLSGTGNENFAISSAGEITVKSTNLANAKATSYALKVTATNSAGESNSALISISHKDITAPIFAKTKSATVVENEEFRLQLEAEDRTAVTFAIDGGVDSDKFSITADGVLTFNGAANYEEPSDSDKNNKYKVRVKATDSVGNDSYQDVTVTVTDVADVAPVLKDTSFEVAENFKSGSLGKVKIENQGDSSITAFTITGTGSENFKIDSHGNISLNTGVTLAKNTSYILKAKATNGGGESNSVTVSIKVTEVQLISFSTPLEVEIMEGEKEVVQLVAESSIEAYPLSYSLSGNDSYKFTIDQYKKVRFKSTTDFENPQDSNRDNIYTVGVIIKDAKNNKITKTLTIRVTNVPDVKPTLKNTTFSIANSIAPNTVVGTIKSNSGDSKVTNMSISGNSASLFNIDKNGVIKTVANIPDGTNSISLKAKATSPAGISNESVITINVMDNNPNVRGVVQLGFLKNASVKIFKINNDGTFRELYTETTTDGGVDNAGRFNTHSSELEDKDYYIYQVTGGESIDVNYDGIEDDNVTTNKGILRAIVRGEWLKTMEDDTFKITALSEKHYVNSLNYIKNNYAGLIGELYKSAKELLEEDINSDGDINAKDILAFNPILDKNMLKNDFKNKFDNVTNNILNHKNDYAYFESRLGRWGVKKIISIELSNDAKTAFISKQDKGILILDVSTIKSTLPDIVEMDVFARSITISKDDKTMFVAGYQNGMSIYDLTDITDPKLLGNIPTEIAVNITLSKDEKTAFIADGTGGMKIVDITDLNNPEEIITVPTNNAIHVALSNDEKTAFIADASKGVRIINITDKTNPEELSLLDTEYARYIALSKDNKIAYLADDDYGLRIIDIEDLQSPKIIGRFKDPTSYTKGAREVHISPDGTKAYLGVIARYLNDMIYSIDITDSKNPKMIDYWNGGMSLELSSDGTKLYSGDVGEDILQILNLEDRSKIIK